MNITNFSVKNYQFTMVIFLMIIVVGIVTLSTIPRAEDPEIKPPYYIISVIYPGTSPKDIEELIVKPIEERISEIENIEKIETNVTDGFVLFFVKAEYGVNIQDSYQELVREINSLQSILPKDIYSIQVRKSDPTDVSIFQIALVSENASFKQLKVSAEELKKKLEKIPGLKKLKISGAPDEQIKIDLNLEKIATLNIPLNLIVGSLQSEAANIPAGNIVAGNKSFNVKTSGNFTDVEDISNTIVFNANGKIIKLKDIAKIEIKNEESRYITRINGFRCILINGSQKSGTNITSIQKKVLPILSAFNQKLPSTIKMVKHFDQADNVSKRLSGLFKDFLIAIGLVLITLLPLGFRASLIVMIAIPLSLALGLIGLNYFGISLNQLSIVGLVVALGLLVDDSIVVVENIERYLREGNSRVKAAIKATSQISLAVIGCTATIVISFLPMVFLPGPSGEFIRGLPLAVICSIIASMFVSLTIVPFIASIFLKEHSNPEGNIFLRLIKKAISGTYTKLMHKALNKPFLTLIISLLLFIGSLSLFSIIGFKLFPASEKPMFLLNVKMPQQTRLSESNRIAKLVENRLKKQKNIKFFTTNIGKGNPQIYYNVPQVLEKINFAQIFIQMDENAKPPEKLKLIQDLRNQFKDFPFAKIEVKDFEQGPPITAPIEINVYGDDLDSLRKISFKVENILKSNKGTNYVENSLNTLKTDLKVNINREKARTLGLFTADIDKTIRLAISGLEVGTFTNNGDSYKIMVSSPKQSYATLDVFKNLSINNALGTPILLSQFATINFETSPTTIQHINKTRVININSSTKKGVLANNVLKEIVPQLDKMKLPEGYYYKLAGEVEKEEETFGGNFIVVIMLSIFLFISVLILQFKTFKGILIVLSVIPLGIIGGVTMLWLSGNPMSFIAILGFIGLAGIEVKNSILLVDFTNQLRQEGVELNTAIEQAGETRFLPVVLTSLTAIGGLIPLALNPNPQISPLAIVLIGGLISSTILSRIVTPVMYKLIPPEIKVNKD